MSEKPFQHVRWDAPFGPTEEKLSRLLIKEGWQALQSVSWSAMSDPEEVKYPQPVILALVEGHVQVAFPGYGVVELQPGDQLSVNPGVLHDVTVLSSSVVAIQGHRA